MRFPITAIATHFTTAVYIHNARPVTTSVLRQRPSISHGRPWTFPAILAIALCCLTYAHASDPTPPPPPPPVNNPPAIVDFVGTQSESCWTFEGQVIDENPQGLIITFGGLLAGHYATVTGADGHFRYTAQVQGPGAVTAYTVDDHDQGSNSALYYIQ